MFSERLRTNLHWSVGRKGKSWCGGRQTVRLPASSAGDGPRRPRAGSRVPAAPSRSLCRPDRWAPEAGCRRPPLGQAWGGVLRQSHSSAGVQVTWGSGSVLSRGSWGGSVLSGGGQICAQQGVWVSAHLGVWVRNTLPVHSHPRPFSPLSFLSTRGYLNFY